MALALQNSLVSNWNACINAGGSLYSSNGRSFFNARSDGNLCVYASISGRQRELWCSGSQGHYDRFCMNVNGEVVAFTYPSNGAVTIWKSGSWNSGQPGPYTLSMQNDGNLVASASNGVSIWSTGTHVSPDPIDYSFSSVEFYNNGNWVVARPMIKDARGESQLWVGNDYWNIYQGRSKNVNLNTDTYRAGDGVERTLSDLIPDGTVVSLGFQVLAGDNDWIEPFTKYQFMFKKDSKRRILVEKLGGLRDGDAHYMGQDSG